MKTNTISILVLIFLFANTLLQAQTLIDDTKTIKVLILENKKKGSTKMISEGAFIKYKLNSDGKVRKGTLEDVKTGMMIVDGKKILFKDCSMIAGRVSSQQQLLGGIALGAGVVSAVLSSAFLGLGTVATSITLGVGVVAIVVGVLFIMRKKHFNLNTNWEVHSGQLKYNTLN